MLRYYEKRGLLLASRQTAGGYREYADSDLDRVEVVVAAKYLGFTLNEMNQIVDVLGQTDEGQTISTTAKERLMALRKEIESVLDRRQKAWSSGKKTKR